MRCSVFPTNAISIHLQTVACVKYSRLVCTFRRCVQRNFIFRHYEAVPLKKKKSKNLFMIQKKNLRNVEIKRCFLHLIKSTLQTSTTLSKAGKQR